MPKHTNARPDYSDARFFAISSIGYGKGFTAEEAVENYVATQLANHPASSTVFGTKAKWEEALRSGEAQADVWQAPEGWTGFVLGFDGLHWTRDVEEGGETKRRHQAANGREERVCSICLTTVGAVEFNRRSDGIVMAICESCHSQG